MRCATTVSLSVLMACAAWVPESEAQTRNFVFESDAPGTTVTARRLKNDRNWVDYKRCAVPCELRVPLMRLGPLVFSHPDHGEHRIEVPHRAWSERGDVVMGVDFDRSEHADDAEFAAALSEALSGPDRSAKLFRRNGAKLEPRMRRSGWCVVLHTIDTRGFVDRPRVRECSEELFTERALLAAQQRRYIPRIESGRAVPTERKKTLVTFKLADERGEPIPPYRPIPKR